MNINAESPRLGAVLQDRAAVRRGLNGEQPAVTRAESPAPAQTLSLGGVSPWDLVGMGH